MSSDISSLDAGACQLSPELEAKARKELGEVPELRNEAIETIRSWLENNETFYSRTDDEFILKFLRNCKFDLEKTKKKIAGYYHVRQINPKWLSRNQENFDIMIELMFQRPRLGVLMNFAGNYDQNIVIVHPGNYDYRKYDVEFIGTGFSQICDLLLRDPRSMIHGFQVVCDCTDLTFSAIMQVTPNMIYRFVTGFQNVMPVRIKGLHLMNAPSFVNKILFIGKMFASKKLKNRLHIHEKEDFSLCDIFPAEALPDEYGGTAGPAQKFTDNLYEFMQNQKEYLLDDEKYGVGKFPESTSSDSDQHDSKSDSD